MILQKLLICSVSIALLGFSSAQGLSKCESCAVKGWNLCPIAPQYESSFDISKFECLDPME